MAKVILNKKQLELTLQRLTLEIIENFKDFKDVAIIGLQPRGIILSRKLQKMLQKQLFEDNQPLYGELDITFYRDDFGRRAETLTPSKLDISFDIENKRILLIDDVLFTGRSIRAALDAISDYGRPKAVELMTLIDRRYNRELPIEADYVGLTVDTRGSGLKVKVDLLEKEEVLLIENK